MAIELKRGQIRLVTFVSCRDSRTPPFEYRQRESPRQDALREIVANLIERTVQQLLLLICIAD